MRTSAEEAEMAMMTPLRSLQTLSFHYSEVALQETLSAPHSSNSFLVQMTLPY